MREARQEGVQATKEVQLSAQRVVRQNVRLRELLRHEGVDDNVIDSWIRKDENVANETTVCTKCSQKESAQITSSQVIDASQLLTTTPNEKKQGNTSDAIADKPLPPQPAIQKSDPKEVESVDQFLASTSDLSSRKCSRASPERAYIAETSSTIPSAPCKLITHLTANPSADITQIPVVIDGMNKPDETDGVECSRAYQMLMQFAMTEEKLDTIALALENGCVANKGPGGGCKVQKESMWKALDDILN